MGRLSGITCIGLSMQIFMLIHVVKCLMFNKCLQRLYSVATSLVTALPDSPLLSAARIKPLNQPCRYATSTTIVSNVIFKSRTWAAKKDS
ncbi:Cytochrome P450 monooxygenase andK [Fusarium oxysporum f. sp. albedinis]|nr:Cytochrome P450 monooxygenase andK [Fusarium oxysporum f. sp. albedinis]